MIDVCSTLGEIEDAMALDVILMESGPMQDSIPISDSSTLPGCDDDDEPRGKKRQGQASKLVAFVQQRAMLFHDLNKDGYAKPFDNGEVLRLGSDTFKSWLSARFYSEEKAAPRGQAMNEAVSVLDGLARTQGESQSVFVRCAVHGDSHYLDLAEEGKGRAVRIRPGSWEIEQEPIVHFTRPGAMRALPEPRKEGNLEPLWKIANVPKSDRILVLAWLCECLRPETPFPVLELIGEQGSAKSTTQRALRCLIDPNKVDLRSLPRNLDDLWVNSRESWLTSYENVSHLSPEFQDALCTLTTGGGYAKRKNFSDAEEVVLDIKRPVILNGIAATVIRPDLVNRTISLELPSLKGCNIEEPVLWSAFQAERGGVLGALLTLFSKALLRLPQARIPSYVPAPDRRLVSFLLLGAAVAEVCGEPPEAFFQPFLASRQEAVSRTLDASAVAVAVQDFIQRFPEGRTDTAGNLFKTMDHSYGGEGWPRSPKGFTDALVRLAPALRQVGIECQRLGHFKDGSRWRIAKI